jgi:branched-chain amino acid transport system substrate-binding protein
MRVTVRNVHIVQPGEEEAMPQDEKARNRSQRWYWAAVSAAVLSVVGLALTTPAPAQKVQEVKVGQVLPLSGGAASQGTQIRVGAEIAAAEINAEGGIKALGGAQIKLVFSDSKSTPDGGMAEAERLIVREKVAILQGAFQSGVTFPATEVAERYKTPWLVNVAAKDEITIGRGFKYVFRDFKTMRMDVDEVVIAMKHLAEVAGTKPKTIGVLCESTDWGRATAAAAKDLLPKAGYLVVMEESYPPGQSDFTPQILKIKAAKPDMLHVCHYTPDHILFNKQVMEQKLYLPYGILSYGAGSEDPAFYKAVPQKAVEYMFVEEDWDIRAVGTAPWYASINGQAKQKLGYDMNAYVACGYGSLYLVKDVLERAVYDASLPKYRDNIRASLAATDLTPASCGRIERTIDGKKYCPAMIRGVERIVFNEHNQNPYAYGSVSQIIKGERTLLFAGWRNPPHGAMLPGAKPIWPLPTWEQRQ